jgi:hypothetical protein
VYAPNDEQQETVLSMDGPRGFNYLLNRLAHCGELGAPRFVSGWALARGGDASKAFPGVVL